MKISDGERCIVLQDGFDEEVVTLLRTVSTEGLFASHFVHCLMHGFNTDRRQGARDITDTQTDNILFRVGDFECVYLLGDVGEEVAAGQL